MPITEEQRAFLKGKTEDEVQKMVQEKDPRIMPFISDPEMRQKLIKGELTQPESPAPEGPEAPKPEDGEPVKHPWEKHGYATADEMAEKMTAMQDALRKSSETIQGMRARDGVEGGKLGQKIKELSDVVSKQQETINALNQARSATPASPATPAPSAEIPELSFPDIDPNKFTDDELARHVQNLAQKTREAYAGLAKANKMRPSQAQSGELGELKKQLGEITDFMSDFKTQQAEAAKKTKEQNARESVNKVYSEIDKFLAENKFDMSRPFKDIDNDITLHRNDPDGGDAFVKTLPPKDLKMHQEVMKIIRAYGGKDGEGIFHPYPNVKDFSHAAYLIQKTDPNSELSQAKIEGMRQGFRQATDAQGPTDSGKGLAPDAIRPEDPEKTSAEREKARFEELTKMGSGALMSSPKLFDEWRTLAQKMGVSVPQSVKPFPTIH